MAAMDSIAIPLTVYASGLRTGLVQLLPPNYLGRTWDSDMERILFTKVALPAAGYIRAGSRYWHEAFG